MNAVLKVEARGQNERNMEYAKKYKFYKLRI